MYITHVSHSCVTTSSCHTSSMSTSHCQLVMLHERLMFVRGLCMDVFLCDFYFGSVRCPFYMIRSVVAIVNALLQRIVFRCAPRDARLKLLPMFFALLCCGSRRCIIAASYVLLCSKWARLKPHLPHARFTRIYLLKGFAFQGCRLGVTHLLRQLGHAGPR